MEERVTGQEYIVLGIEASILIPSHLGRHIVVYFVLEAVVLGIAYHFVGAIHHDQFLGLSPLTHTDADNASPGGQLQN